MNSDTLEILTQVIRETFDEPAAFVNRETIAYDIPGWDSLSHTLLMLTIEERFKIKLKPETIYENVGELVDIIDKLRISSES